jgi:hypothetical protein
MKKIKMVHGVEGHSLWQHQGLELLSVLLLVEALEHPRLDPEVQLRSRDQPLLQSSKLSLQKIKLPLRVLDQIMTMTLMREANTKAIISTLVTAMMIWTSTMKVEIKKRETFNAPHNLLADQLPCLQAGHRLIGVKHLHQWSLLRSEAELMLIKMM